MKIKYVSIKSGNTQYTVHDEYNSITDAIYIHSLYPAGHGNILIEALPLPRIEGEEYYRAYSKGLIRQSCTAAQTRLQKLLEIWGLADIRFPLPFHRLLEEEFYHVLITSYEKRRIITYKNSGVIVRVDEEDTYQKLITLQKKGGAVPGFSLIGMSGSGKSSALEVLTSHYPQAIRHHLENENTFVQIVYLNVECHTHGNMRAIYEGIGHAIDLALCNYNPYYELQLGKKKDTLGEKEQILRRLIERFGIGVIILEEIQNMEFESTNEKSYENFLTLCNDTGVALVVVGTENARSKMFPTLRIANRIGIEISSSHSFSESTAVQIGFIKELFAFQWFDNKVEVTNAIAKKIIANSHSVIGVMVRIYMFMCIDYVRAKEDNKPVIDEKYVDKISQKYFLRIIELLESSKESEDVYFQEIEKLDKLQKDIIIEEKEKEEATKLANAADRIAREVELKGLIIGVTTAFFPGKYSEDYLERIINEELEKGTFDGMSNQESLNIWANILEGHCAETEKQGTQKKDKCKTSSWKDNIDEMRQKILEAATSDPLNE